jgi:hypothetical protein
MFKKLDKSNEIIEVQRLVQLLNDKKKKHKIGKCGYCQLAKFAGTNV